MNRGISANLLGAFPYSGIMFYGYEMTKRYVLRLKGQEHLTTIQNLLVGGLSGCMASFLTYPIEIVTKRR